MQENIKLAPYTTFRIGGNARYFVNVRSIDDLKTAIEFARSKDVPYFVLGGGSNVLVNDNGFNGLVIKIDIEGVEYEDLSNFVYVKTGAGINWDTLVQDSVNKNLSGLENLSLIPGQVGASVVQNIGAYGEEVKNSVEAVKVFNIDKNKEELLTKGECNFGYRNSIFKSNQGKDLIVLSVVYKLNKDFFPNLSYQELANKFSNSKAEISINNVRDAVISIRSNKLPSLHEYGTAGSYFKNPEISNMEFNKLIGDYPNCPNWKQDSNKVKVSAGFLIDKVANMKGESVGDAHVWEKQALVIVNYGNATAEDVKNLANKIKNKIFELTKINLENEVVEII